jgi:hypothetical protein
MFSSNNNATAFKAIEVRRLQGGHRGVPGFAMLVIILMEQNRLGEPAPTVRSPRR